MTAVGLFIAGTKSNTTKQRHEIYSRLPSMRLLPSLTSQRWRMFLCWAEPRDGFIVLAGCYQGGSANTTADEERLLYSRGYLRQEENQYLANDVERIKELPVWLQRFAGYSLSRPFMGWVDMDDPMKVINPNYRTKGNLWWLVLLWWQAGSYLAGRTRLAPRRRSAWSRRIWWQKFALPKFSLVGLVCGLAVHFLV